MRRVSAAVFFATLMMTAGARASSFVTLEAMDEPAGPSFVTLGEPETPAVAMREEPSGDEAAVSAPREAAIPLPEEDGQQAAKDDQFISVSPSIIAMAEPAMPVSNENVASIDPDDQADTSAPDNPVRQFDALPTVIRGGIVGDAFAHSITEPSPAKSVAPKATASASQRDRMADRRTPDPQPQKPRPEPEAVAVPSGLPRLSGPK